MGTLHCALENGADLYVNERQKIRIALGPNRDFFYSRGAYIKFRCYTLVRLEISHGTRWWCLKCVIVYLARVIPAFVMYCVNGASRSSLYLKNEKTFFLMNKK